LSLIKLDKPPDEYIVYKFNSNLMNQKHGNAKQPSVRDSIKKQAENNIYKCKNSYYQSLFLFSKQFDQRIT